MIKIYVDSGSSIKQEEKAQYNVEIFPLKILLNEVDYLDGVNLTTEEFYHQLIDNNQFPKTSLPAIPDYVDEITAHTDNGDDVLILSLSSGLSGTYNYCRQIFEDNPKVHVVDSKTAIGGIRLIVEDILRHPEENIEQVLARIENLIPRICLVAVPETLTYLLRGGRLNKTSYLIGNILNILPVISMEDGKVKVLEKKRGFLKALQSIANLLSSSQLDPDHNIIAMYTYSDANLSRLVGLIEDKFKEKITVSDNASPTIAAHWGPNACGVVFVVKDPLF